MIMMMIIMIEALRTLRGVGGGLASLVCSLGTSREDFLLAGSPGLG